MKLFKQSIGLALLGISTFCAQTAWAQCNTNNDCTVDPTAKVCNTNTNTCVGCLNSNDCATSLGGKICSATNTCVECNTSADCAGAPGGSNCNANSCVCATNNDCVGNTNGPQCNKFNQASPFGTCGPECVDDSMCVGNTKGPKCDTTSRTCGQCLADGDCAGNLLTPKCNVATKTCVGCNNNADCTLDPMRTLCDPAAKRCVGCFTNADCATSLAGSQCNLGSCACIANADCVGNANGPQCNKPAQGVTTGTCGPECVNDGMCAGNPKGSKCDPGTRTCGQCLANADCAGNPAGTVCNTDRKTCTALPQPPQPPLSTVLTSLPVTQSPPAAGASSTPVVASSVAGVSSAPVIVSTVSGASSAPVAASSPAAGSTGLVNPPATGYTGTPNLAAQGIQTFNVFERAGTGQSVNIEFIDASGNRVVYLLTSLGCKSVPVGQSPFTDGTSPAGVASKQACVTTCAPSFKLNSYVGSQCYCGSTLKDLPTVPCPAAPARLVRRQGGNTAQVIQVDPPTVPISSTTSGSGTSTRSSTSSSTSAPATSIPTGTSINTSSGSTSRTASSSSSTSTNTSTGSGTANTGTTTAAGSPTTSPSTGMGTGTGAGEETGIPGSEPDPSSAPAPTASGLGTVNPINIGGFTYLGCYGSPSSFPTFNLLLSAEAMTNDRCIAQCGPTGKRYAATFGRDCFCGDFIDDVNEIKTPEEQCNLSCPGNGRQVCGGRAANPVVKAKRQLPGVIPAVIRFSIYVRNGAAPPGVSGVPSGTAVIPGTTNPCANGRCPNIPCYGDDCYKIIVCYGGYCAFNFPCFGSDCHRRLVCNDGIWRPEACTGYDCGRKVVCVSGHCNYVEKGMAEWNEKVTCHGNYCQVEKCSGDACNQKYVCKDGSCVFTNSTAADALNKYEWSGDKYTVVNSCEPNCPKPQPPCATCGIVISQAPVTQTTCVGASCSTIVVPQPPITKVPYQTAQPTAQPPAETGKVVVVAGTIKFAASVGAVVFGVMAAAILL